MRINPTVYRGVLAGGRPSHYMHVANDCQRTKGFPLPLSKALALKLRPCGREPCQSVWHDLLRRLA